MAHLALLEHLQPPATSHGPRWGEPIHEAVREIDRLVLAELVGARGWHITLVEDLVVRLIGRDHRNDPQRVRLVLVINPRHELLGGHDLGHLAQQNLLVRLQGARLELDRLELGAPELTHNDPVQVLLGDERGLVRREVPTVPESGLVELALGLDICLQAVNGEVL